jgi:hypothetical protein
MRGQGGYRLSVCRIGIGRVGVGWSRKVGFNAFSTALRPGVHTAKVPWHSFPEGATFVEERSLIVLRP